MTITRRSTYEQIVKEINDSTEEVLGDIGVNEDVPADEVWADLAASLLIDAKPDVAREVCRTQLGYTPQTLESLWAAQDAARAAFAKAKAKAAAEKKKADRRQAAVDARHAERDAVRAARCPECWTVPSAAGQCMCLK